MFTELCKERDSLAATMIPPGTSLNNNTASTGTVDMSLFNRVVMYFMTGTGNTSTISAYLQQSDNSNGVGAVNITNETGGGQLITGNITNLGNQQNSIELNSTQISKRYVLGVVQETQAIAHSVCAIMVATEARFHPQGSDSTQVNQRVYDPVS